MSAPVEITYTFHFGSGSGRRIGLRFEAERFDLIVEENAPPPAWAALAFARCDHCPLSGPAWCPFARVLAPLVPVFLDFYSYDDAVVEVVTARRTVVAKGALQQGTASLIGLVGATSGCPHLDFYRPMARFHLPFASEEETLVRLFSFHLLACEVRGEPLRLGGLESALAAAARVNRAMADRLRAGLPRDAMVNGLIILDTFAQAATYVMAKKLAELAYLFAPVTDREETR